MPGVLQTFTVAIDGCKRLGKIEVPITRPACSA
jgi:hypothetical protein